MNFAALELVVIIKYLHGGFMTNTMFYHRDLTHCHKTKKMAHGSQLIIKKIIFVCIAYFKSFAQG